MSKLWGTVQYAIRQAFRKIIFEPKLQKGSATYWHLNTALWYYSSKLHYNDNYMFFMWSAFAPSEKVIGLNNSAKYYFQKELSELNFREKTEIIAMVRFPQMYKIGSPKLNERVNSILQNK